MAEQATLVATLRDNVGSSHARRLRAGGKVPAIVYDAGQVGTTIALDAHDFEAELRRHTSENVMIDVDVEGRGLTKVLIKEVQHHPLSGRILHVDLQAVSMTETLRVPVTVELEGEPVGVTQFGGVLEQLLREVEVECLPSDIPDVLVYDVSGLGVGEALLVGAARVDPEKVRLVTDAKIAVAHVSAPRVSAEEEAGETEGAGGEPEVITERAGDDNG